MQLTTKSKIALLFIALLLAVMTSLILYKFSFIFEVTENADEARVVSIALKKGVSQQQFEKLLNEEGLNEVINRPDIVISRHISNYENIRILNVYGNGGHATYIYQNGYFVNKSFSESKLERKPK